MSKSVHSESFTYEPKKFSPLHRDRINRLIALSRYGNGWLPATHKWCYEDPDSEESMRNGKPMDVTRGRKIEYHVWTVRVTSLLHGLGPCGPCGPCPVCRGETIGRRCGDREVYDAEYRCRGCVWWHSGYSQGHHEEQIGFCWFDWTVDGFDADTGGLETIRQRQEVMVSARDEIRRALADPEFVSMTTDPRGVPIGIVADWLDDHGFSLQAKAAHEYDPVALLPHRVVKGVVNKWA